MIPVDYLSTKPGVSVLSVVAATSAVALLVLVTLTRRRRQWAPPETSASTNQGAPESKFKARDTLYQRYKRASLPGLAISCAGLAVTLGVMWWNRGSSSAKAQQCAAATIRSPKAPLSHLAALARAPRPFNSSFPASPHEEAQSLFDAGMIAAAGFNHMQAQLLFEAAVAADRYCALCVWGVAYVQGPYVNKVALDAAQPPPFPVFNCTHRAQAAEWLSASRYAVGTPQPLASALLLALHARYGQQGTGEVGGAPAAPSCDTAALRDGNTRYIQVMQSLAEAFSEEPTVLALAAEALLIPIAWRYAPEPPLDTVATGAPQSAAAGTERDAALFPGAAEARALLERALALDANNVLALHLVIHLLETRPSESEGLRAAVAAADALAALGESPALPGHLQHMPAHAYIRVGRWHSAAEASQRAVAKDVTDSHACAIPYMPEHNLNMAVFVAVATGNYSAAVSAARHLTAAHRLFNGGYMTAGVDHATLLEVHVFFGRCRGSQLRAPPSNSRGQSSKGASGFMAALFSWRNTMCALQEEGLALQRAGGVPVSAERAEADAGQDSALAALEAAADRVVDDPLTEPGYGLGVYSPGYRTLASMFLLMAKATRAALSGHASAAVTHLREAVALEGSMGYVEPPRMLLPLRPCLAEQLLRSGRLHEAGAEVQVALREWPGSAWAAHAADVVATGSVSIAVNHTVCRFMYGWDGLGAALLA